MIRAEPRKVLVKGRGEMLVYTVTPANGDVIVRLQIFFAIDY